MKPDRDLLTAIETAALAAGAVTLPIYRSETIDRTVKTDGSPVTEADHRAEAVLMEHLGRLTPEIPVVAEEAAEAGRIPDIGNDPFWLVDPLDGTKEFLNRRDSFTVNVALIVDRRPVLGVVYAPALADSFAGAIGLGAWRRQGDGEPEPIRARPAPANGLAVVASRSHGDPAKLAAFLQGRPVLSRLSIGSSLKFCLLAAGEADLYPRFGPTMEWDVAAGHAVLRAAGGRVETLVGEPFLYGKPGFRNPEFVAYGA